MKYNAPNPTTKNANIGQLVNQLFDSTQSLDRSSIDDNKNPSLGSSGANTTPEQVNFHNIMNGIGSAHQVDSHIPTHNIYSQVALNEMPLENKIQPFLDIDNSTVKGSNLAAVVADMLPDKNTPPNPIQIIQAQTVMFDAVMAWGFTSQVAGKIDTAFSTLFNSQA